MFKQVKIAWGPSLLLTGVLLLWQPPLWSGTATNETSALDWALASAVDGDEHVEHDDSRDIMVVDEQVDVSKMMQTLEHPPVATVGGPYIGVRLAPLPEALKAHVGDEGLMVTNIIATSPADQAGVQRYDIILSFDEHVIQSPDQLVNLVKEAVDRSVTMQIKRKQETLDVKLRPQKRAIGEPVEWKFAPEAPLWDDWRQMRGMKLQRDENGNWRMLDLGELNDEDHTLRRFDIDFTKRFPGRDIFFFDGGHLGPVDEQEIIDIERIDDDQRLRIQRNEEGITVTRTDANGVKEVRKYENDDQLHEADPDAYDFLTESKHQATGHFEFHWPQDIENLEVLRKDFQFDLQRQIDDTMRASKDVREQAQDFAREVKDHAVAIAESARQAFGGEVEKHVLRDSEGGELLVYKHDDGSMRVIHRPSPEEEHLYRFDTEDAFAERLPKLHQQFADSLSE